MIKKISILLISILLLTGCVGKLKPYDSLTEEEIKDYAKKAIYKNTGEEVEVEIESKVQEYLCDANIDATCFGKHKVPQTYTYYLTITNKNNPEIKAEKNYFTDSYKENDNIIEKDFDYEKYQKKFAQVKFNNDIDKLLQGYKYENINNDIFILSEDYEYLHHDFFSYILNINYIYYEKRPVLSYDIYVTKDEETFNRLKAENTYDVPQEAQNIKNTYGYARDYMEIEQADGYKHVFFRYSSNGCKGSLNCSVVYGLN